MAEQADLDSRIDRLDAALTATSEALERALAQMAPEGAEDPEVLRRDLDAATAKVETLEVQLAERDDAVTAAVTRAEAAEAARSGADAETTAATEALHREVDDLKAARAQDLSEMKTLLAELAPILESADA